MKNSNDSDYGSNFKMCIGIVKNNADPMQHGRLQIYIPSEDNRYYKLENLPWSSYIAPFGGTTLDATVGRSGDEIPGITTYGFWAIPKNGAQVLCGFLEGSPQMRFWMGGVYMPELNRTLPSSVDPIMTELDDSNLHPQKQIPHIKANLTKAGLEPGSTHYKTRGGYERSVSYPQNKTDIKPTTNGYAKNVLQPELSESQAVCLTSPGRHYMVMSDVDEYCRIRLKTTEGSQIIFDDTNERIYISTAQGKNWVELDEGNGKIYIYSDSKINIRGKNDVNIYSDENVNIVAKKRVNIKSEERSVNLEALHDVRLLSTQADVMITASRDLHLKTLNGPRANPAAEESFGSTSTGWVYRWSEKGGSTTSNIKIDSAQAVDMKALNSINATASNSINISTMLALNLRSGSNVNIQGDLSINLTQTASNSIILGVPGISFFSSMPLGLIVTDPISGVLVTTATPSPAIPPSAPILSASPADPVKTNQVTDHMIRPDHESWVRDEDESKHKTPRNKSYKG